MDTRVGETEGSWGGPSTYDFVRWIGGGITNGPPVDSKGEGRRRGGMVIVNRVGGVGGSVISCTAPRLRFGRHSLLK